MASSSSSSLSAAVDAVPQASEHRGASTYSEEGTVAAPVCPCQVDVCVAPCEDNLVKAYLVRRYVCLHPSVRPLICTVRRWALARGLVGARTQGGELNAFCFTLMAIQLLQRVSLSSPPPATSSSSSSPRPPASVSHSKSPVLPPVLPVLPNPVLAPAGFSGTNQYSDLRADRAQPLYSLDESGGKDDVKMPGNEHEHGLGLLLLHFFKLYGETFNPDLHVVDISNPSCLLNNNRESINPIPLGIESTLTALRSHSRSPNEAVQSEREGGAARAPPSPLFMAEMLTPRRREEHSESVASGKPGYLQIIDPVSPWDNPARNSTPHLWSIHT